MRTLIVSAHPDDEVISCGGLIQNRIDADHKVHVLVMCGRINSESWQLLDEFCKAEKVLGGKSSGRLTHVVFQRPEGEPYSQGYYDWIMAIENELSIHAYDEVVIPSSSDLNQDHRHLHDCCKIALRPANLGTVRRILISHGMDGGTAPTINWYEPMSIFKLKTKIKALNCYKSEVRKSPHPRSPELLEAHAKVVGSRAGFGLAEGYTLFLSR